MPKKITDLTTLITPTAGCYIPLVDVLDTTDAATGTTKKIKYSSLVPQANPAIPAPVSAVTQGFRGLNISGGEFSGSFQANSQAIYTYTFNKGFNVVRVPFDWYKLQPTLNGALNTTELGYLQQQVAWAKTAGLSVILDLHNYGRRIVYGNGGLVDDFTSSPQYSLSYPYADQNAGAGEITLRDYGRGTFGTINNPVGPATSYRFSLSFKVASIANAADEAIFEVFRLDDNNRYWLAFNPTAGTWVLRKTVAGITTNMTTGAQVLTIGTLYTLAIDVGQATAGKINVTFNGSPLFTNNSVSTDAALTKGYAAIFPTALHLTVKAITLNVAGDTTTGQPTNYRVTDAQLPMSAWNDLWTRISTVFKAETAVIGYDMNEPYGMPIPTSPTNYSQAVATANAVPLSTCTNMYQNMLTTIRTNGDTKYIFVGWDSFSNLQQFTNFLGANPTPWVIDTITPAKVVYAPHYYFDTDHSGTYATNTLPSNATVLSEAQPFFTWAKNRSIPAAVLEYGVPANSVWYPTLEYFMSLMDQYGVWGTYWAAGDLYTSITSIQPSANYTVDSGQMATVTAHLAGSAPVLISDLKNVSINQAVANDILIFDGTNWTNQKQISLATDKPINFKTGATDVFIDYAGTGTDALLLSNTNAGSGRIKMSYATSVVFDLYGTGAAMTLNSSGSVGIGITPTAKLHLKAGTASANTAPLKLTSGTSLTTPEDGAFEYNGTNLFFTVGGVRKTVTLT